MNADVSSEDRPCRTSRSIPRQARWASPGTIPRRPRPGRALRASVRTGRAAPPGSPAAPTNLRATAVSRSQIDLVWEDRSGNETGFEITRSSSGASPQTFCVTAGTTSFSDTGLAEDTTYTYVVRAFDGIGFSEPSNEAAATTFDSPPSVPTNLRATAVGSNRIDLDWIRPTTRTVTRSSVRSTGSPGHRWDGARAPPQRPRSSGSLPRRSSSSG